MSLLWFGLLTAICWQPWYLLVRAIYHLIKRDTWDSAAYLSALKDWFLKLFTLVFSKPAV